jgi:hypothetical protein
VLKVSNITISANPCIVGQTIIISCSIAEIYATWADIATEAWNNLISKTWDQAYNYDF